MRLVARFKDQRDIQYIRDVYRMCGPKVTERTFINAAVIHYCQHLVKLAQDMRNEAIKKKTEEQANKTEEIKDVQSGSTDAVRTAETV